MALQKVGKGMLEVYGKYQTILNTIKTEKAELAIRAATERQWLHAHHIQREKERDRQDNQETPEGITTTEILGAYPHETGITLPYKTLAKYLTELHREGRIRAKRMTGCLEDRDPTSSTDGPTIAH